MWRVTLPYLWRTGRQEWRNVLVVAAGGIIAGGVGTSKSLLESGIIQQVADAITNEQTSSVWSRTLERFSSTDEDWASRLTGWLLPGISLREAVIAYLLVSVTGAAVVILTASARESSSRSLFARLYADGLSSAFENNAAPTVQANEPGGLAGAVQQGARSVSAGYAFLVEAFQYVFALATIVLLLAGVSGRFAELCVLLAVIFAVVSWIRGRHLAARREEFDKQRRDLFAFTDDVISNRDVLLAHERKKLSVERLTGAARRLATVDKQLTVRERVYSGTVNVLYDAGRIGILAVVLWEASRGSPVGKVGDAYFYVSLFTHLMAPVQGQGGRNPESEVPPSVPGGPLRRPLAQVAWAATTNASSTSVSPDRLSMKLRPSATTAGSSVITTASSRVVELADALAEPITASPAVTTTLA